MVLTYYHPHWTGLTAYARRLAEGMAARGHPVTVLTSRHAAELAREEVHNGVRIVRLDRLARISRGTITPAFPITAYRLIKEHDVVQLHTPLMESPIVTMIANRLGKKVLFTHHGDLVMPAGLFNQTVETVVTWMMVQAMKGSACVSIHSKDYADNSAFLRPFQHKMAYICPPIEMPQPDPEAVAAWRRKLGYEDAQLIAFAGRFVEEKGFDYLLKAIPYVLEREPRARFVYAGDHKVVYESFFEKWYHLVQKYQDYITLVGLILDPQEMANFYAMGDVFCLPSRTDCFPSTQIEAMMCGAPVVATDIPGGRVAVRETGMGLLVAPRDERALAEGLLTVLGNRERYLRTRAQICATFNLQRTLDEYEQLLQSLATSS